MARRFLEGVFLIVIVYGEDAVRFDNYKMYRMTAQSMEQLQHLQQLEGNGVMFWSEPRSTQHPVDVMVSPQRVADFQNEVQAMNILSELCIADVQAAVDNERPPLSQRTDSFDWSDYHSLDSIYEWMDKLVAENKNVSSLLVGGLTYEGRQIRGVKVSFKSGNPGVYVEGGIHAREWISPATVTFILGQLLTSKDPQVRDIAENYDWYVFPSINPDGYEYSHTMNRMWRKTRTPYTETCFGADPNRNWDFYWNGTKGNPCSDTYAGPRPFSEIETSTLAKFITGIANNIDVFLSFHSYSQLLLLPYGNGTLGVDNFQTLMDIGMKAVECLSRRYGTKYRVGNIVDIIYPASGISMDWVRSKFEIPITYTYELRDAGCHGFLLPAKYIVPTGLETLDSVITILHEARKL